MARPVVVRAPVPVKHTKPIDLGVATLAVQTLSAEVSEGDDARCPRRGLEPTPWPLPHGRFRFSPLRPLDR